MMLAMNWVLTTISSTVDWLKSWSFNGVPFLYFLIAVAITGILIRRLFG